MIVGCEADGVTVPIPPRVWLYRLPGTRRVEPRAQDSTIANSMMVRTLERLHGRSGALHAEGGVPAGLFPTAGVKHVVAQHNAWQGISCWFVPPPLSRPTTPLLVVDPCD